MTRILIGVIIILCLVSLVCLGEPQIVVKNFALI